MNNKKIVLTYWTFDNFHIWHLNILKRAKEYWDYLIVWLSSDEFNLKKHKKCVYSYEERKSIISSIKYVNEIIKEEDWEQKINDIKNNNVNIFIMWDDWTGKFDFLKEFCDVIYLPRTPWISTSSLKNKFVSSVFLENWEKDNNFVSEWTWLFEHYIYRPIVSYLVKKWFFINISPNILTFIWLLWIIISSLFIINWNIILWTILYFIFPFIDILDWAVARYYKKTSLFWALIDWFIDTFGEIIILFSFWIYFNKLIIFLYLITLILLIQLFSIRIKWIYKSNERQLNFLNFKWFKLFLILLTRNDTRKLLLIISAFFDWRISILYFVFLYLLALLNNFISIYKTEK
jgi:glycerol-3-phosphate cytidylyltransferase